MLPARQGGVACHIYKVPGPKKLHTDMTRKALWTLLIAVSGLSGYAQAPAESEDIMLQGFYWDSQKTTGWKQLTTLAGTIADHFDWIWLPPSAAAEGGGPVGGQNVGYHPRQWNDQNSCWGTAEDLKNLIAGLHTHRVRVIADIVVNHRAGATGWGDFTADDFGQYGAFQLTEAHICNNDEMNTDPSSGTWYGRAAGASDTGENWGGARDLDHTSAYVQQDIEAYLNWLHGEFGYDGWRYDFCKGYDGKYVGMFNDASAPGLSVGEYWDGSYDAVAAWIDATGNKSMAFDFPMKYAALNNGLARFNYAKMSWIEDNTTWRPAGMIHHHKYDRYAVTFVDNHDTYRDNSRYTGNVQAAYAFILSSAGVPCVFWPHWQSTDGQAIEQMISIRRAAGVHSQSKVTVTQRTNYYESIAEGHHGTLLTRIGTTAMPTDVPDGYTLAGKGSMWQMYLSDDAAGIHSPSASLQGVKPLRGGLQIRNPEGRKVVVTDDAGKCHYDATTAEVTLSLPAGVYVVSMGSASGKYVVR